MTDRIMALTVLLESDVREDDAQSIVDAILMLKRVVAVETHVKDLGQWAAEEKVRLEFREKLWSVLYPDRRET